MSTSPSGKLVITAAAAASLSTALVSYWWHRQQVRRVQHDQDWPSLSRHDRAALERQVQNLEARRQEERTGRIRAEVKLRTAIKEAEQLRLLAEHGRNINANSKPSPVEKTEKGTITAASDDTTRRAMVLHAIGTVVSPYTKRMGTPRQSQLVPSSRGFIEFHHVPAATLSGISDYSHIWVIFEFHANTDMLTNNNSNNKRTKIRPPRGGGVKVGQLATRSPHRPNPLGLSLVCVERWDQANRRLYISGLDLVNGTPVYDVKPCVPWDRPSTLQRVPKWVSQDDAIASVHCSHKASAHLKKMVSEGRLAPLYTVDNDGYNGALQTLREVLAQDPRSSHKGIQDNARGTLSPLRITGGVLDKRLKEYNFVFGQCQVEFVVVEEGVQVTDISAIDFDPESYVDGVPLVSESGHTIEIVPQEVD